MNKQNQTFNSCLTLHDPVHCSRPGLPVPHHLPEFAQTHVHWIGDAIQPSHPLSPSSPSAFSLSKHRGLFQWVRSLHQVVKVLELQHQSFQEYSGLISSKIDWFDLLAVQGTLKSLQHHSSKASILQHSVFFMVQLSHLYMTTGQTITLTTWTFVGEVMPLLFSTLSGFVITFQSRSNCLLISGFYLFFTEDIFYLFVYQEAIKIHLSTLQIVDPPHP